MMGTGKSTAGAIAARALEVPFHDTDEMVVREAGKSISDIWQESGEEAFRMLEERAVAAVPAGGVAAAGGGAVISATNRAVMRSNPPVVWLWSDPSRLAERTAQPTGRPLLDASEDPVDTLWAILRRRSAAYEAASTHRIDTDDMSVEEIAEELVGLWPG